MARTYKKKGSRCQWSNDDLHNAVADVKSKVFSIRAASRAYNIPRSTLQEYVNDAVRKHKLQEQHVPGKVGRYPVLGDGFEKELRDHVKLLSDMYFGITKDQLCRLAYEVAEKNGIRHRFNKEKQAAGNDWFYGFMQRNRSVSLRTPESTSLARVIGFRRTEVMRFFDNLKTVFEKEKIDASRVYNIDETGMSTVQKQRTKILATTGKKQVGRVVSAEKGETVTAVVCISASGSFIPPMLIFPRKNLNDRLLHGAPPGTIGATSPSGWINSQLYIQWLRHFIKHSGATADHKVLLILDNHESHVSLDAWDLCRANGITVISLPPHCSHRCQPLDIAVFGPLKSAYYRRCDEWMKSHPGKRITQYEVAGLFGDAYCSVATIQKCISGFRSAGIVPLNSSVFTDEDFAAADNLVSRTTEQPQASVSAVNRPLSPVLEAASIASTTVDMAGSVGSTNTIRAEPNLRSEPEDTAGSSATTDTIGAEPETVHTAGPVTSTDIVQAEVAEPAIGVEPADTAGSLATTDTIGAEPETVHTAGPVTSTDTIRAESETVDTIAAAASTSSPPAKKKRYSVFELSPIPAATPSTDKTRRKKCKRSEVFTASPMKVILEAKALKKSGSANKSLKKTTESENLAKKKPERKNKRTLEKKAERGNHGKKKAEGKNKTTKTTEPTGAVIQ